MFFFMGEGSEDYLYFCPGIPWADYPKLCNLSLQNKASFIAPLIFVFYMFYGLLSPGGGIYFIIAIYIQILVSCVTCS